MLGAVFALMEAHHAVWARLEGSNPVKLFGFRYEVGVEPVHVNVERMIEHFQLGLADLQPVWRQVLREETLAGLLPLKTVAPQQFRIPDELWVRVVYDAALAYHDRVMPREHLLKALTPLYLGRTATFVLETQALTTTEAERRIEQLCDAFEKQKPYLVERWKQEPVT